MKKPAIELVAGDRIIGDRMYRPGTLDFTVVDVETETYETGRTLVRVRVDSGPYAIRRMISYRSDEPVVLRVAS